MNAAVQELKTRARIGLKALKAGDLGLVERAGGGAARKGPLPPEWQLRHALSLVAQGVGFRHWEHARSVLGGLARPGDDMGTFWHALGCSGLLNHWFARHDEAADFLRARGGAALLTYRRQYLVVDEHYLRELGLADRLPQPDGAPAFDAVADYGSPRWVEWCMARLRAPLGTWRR